MNIYREREWERLVIDSKFEGRGFVMECEPVRCKEERNGGLRLRDEFACVMWGRGGGVALCCGGVAYWCRSLYAASLEYPCWPRLL